LSRKSLSRKSLSRKPSSSSACVLFIHGGGFTEDQPRTPSYDAFGYMTALTTGYDTYVPDYTLAPIAQYPVQVEQMLRVAERLGKLYDRVILGGDSAGGTIALQMCLTSPRLFSAAFVVSAWVDLDCNGRSYYSRAWNAKTSTGDPVFRDPPEKEIRDSREEAMMYLGNKTLFDNPVGNPINATDAALRKLPPFLFMIGDDEVIRDGTLKLAARAQLVNNNVFASLYQGMWHDWVLYSQRSSGSYGDLGMQTIAAFCVGRQQGGRYAFDPPKPRKKGGPMVLDCLVVV